VFVCADWRSSWTYIADDDPQTPTSAEHNTADMPMNIGSPSDHASASSNSTPEKGGEASASVYAVILVRDSFDAKEAKVLLPSRSFKKFSDKDDDGRRKDIVTAKNLATEASARALMALRERDSEASISMHTFVFGKLPVAVPEGLNPKLTINRPVRLIANLEDEALENKTKLRNQEGHPIAEEFYVLVTRVPHQQSTEEKSSEPGISSIADDLSCCFVLREHACVLT